MLPLLTVLPSALLSRSFGQPKYLCTLAIGKTSEFFLTFLKNKDPAEVFVRYQREGQNILLYVVIPPLLICPW